MFEATTEMKCRFCENDGKTHIIDYVYHGGYLSAVIECEACNRIFIGPPDKRRPEPKRS